MVCWAARMNCKGTFVVGNPRRQFVFVVVHDVTQFKHLLSKTFQNEFGDNNYGGVGYLVGRWNLLHAGPYLRMSREHVGPTNSLMFGQWHLLHVKCVCRFVRAHAATTTTTSVEVNFDGKVLIIPNSLLIGIKGPWTQEKLWNRIKVGLQKTFEKLFGDRTFFVIPSTMWCNIFWQRDQGPLPRSLNYPQSIGGRQLLMCQFKLLMWLDA